MIETRNPKPEARKKIPNKIENGWILRISTFGVLSVLGFRDSGFD